MGVVLESLPWDTLGLGGLCLGMIATLWRLLSTGKFVPAEQVDRIVSEHKERIRFLESALSKKDETVTELVTQVAKLTVQGDVSVRVLESLPGARTAAHRGSDDVASAPE